MSTSKLSQNVKLLEISCRGSYFPFIDWLILVSGEADSISAKGARALHQSLPPL